MEDTRIDERIKEAHLTPHLNSRLDSAEEKIHPQKCVKLRKTPLCNKIACTLFLSINFQIF